MDAYNITLHAHSGFRWIALVLAVILTIKSLIGLLAKSKYQKLDNILAASFAGTMHLQLLLGLLLYFFLSPVMDIVFQDFGAAMKSPDLRFYAMEHITMMIAAIAAAQIGRTKSKKSYEANKKFKLQLIFFGLSLVLMLLAIPWDKV